MHRFGCAKRIISDQGREFVNSINSHLHEILGTEHRITSAYHPQTNGLVEKLNSTIQGCLIKLCNDHQNNWDQHLDSVLFAIRTSKQKSTGYTPFELMYRYAMKWLSCVIIEIFLLFSRKAVLPVELHFNQKVDDELEDQGAYSIEQKIEKLVNLREKVFSSAAKNIERAQKRY